MTTEQRNVVTARETSHVRPWSWKSYWLILFLFGCNADSTNTLGPTQAQAQQIVPAGQVKQLAAAQFFAPRKLDRVPPGTVISNENATGFSHLLIFVKGELTAGDVASVSDTVKYYGDLFNLVYLANVKQVNGLFELDKVAIGFSSAINEQQVIVSSATAKQLGLNLSMIGGTVLAGNEDALDEIKVVAQNRAQIVIDAPSIMFRNGKHEKMVARYFIWVSQKNGNIGTLVWLLEKKGEQLSFAENHMNLLKTPMVEQRVMHVDGNEFFLGMPSKSAFAMVSLPKGTLYKVTPALLQSGAESKFAATTFENLASALKDALTVKPAVKK